MVSRIQFRHSLRRQSFLRTVAVIFTFFFSMNSWALDQSESKGMMKILHEIQSHAYMAMNAYYNFSMNPGDKQQRVIMDEQVQSVDGLLTELESAPGMVDIQAEVASINEQWLSFKELLETNVNDILDLGYPELRLVNDLSQSSLDLIDAAKAGYSKASQKSGYSPDKLVALIRESKLTLESMMTSYAARTASSVSQVFQGADDDTAIDEQAKLFDRNLTQIQSSELGSSDHKKTLDSIHSKWNFIRKSFVNYNENNVSYVVNLYSTRIVNDLDKLLTALTNTETGEQG